MLPQADYDRTGTDSAYGRPDFPRIKEELVAYCENEMEVHPDARDSVVHEWLKPKGQSPNRARRNSLQTAKANQVRTQPSRRPSLAERNAMRYGATF